MNKLSIYLLTLGTFLIGTTEMIVAGIVHMIADHFHITIALAGQLVSAFSLAFAIGTPIIVTLTSRFDRKKVLLGTLSLFMLGNLISTWSPNFTTLLLSRVLLGISAGVFIVVATSVAAKLVPPEKMGNAVSTVSIGFGTSLVLGVPLGIMISQWLGWKLVFALLAILSLLILIALVRLLPSLPGESPVPLKEQFSILKNRKIVGGLLIFLFLITGYGSAYTYLAPFLQETVQLDTSAISMAMLIFGAFALIGTKVGGIGADQWGTVKTIISSIAIHVIALILLPLFTGTIYGTLIVAAIWIGAANITIPALQTYFIQQAPRSSDLALSASSSIAQLGLAIGAGLGGITVNSLGATVYNPWISSIVVLLGLCVAWVTFIKQKHFIWQSPQNR